VTTAQLLYIKPTYSTVVIVTLLHSDAKRHNYWHLYFSVQYGDADQHSVHNFIVHGVLHSDADSQYFSKF